MDNADRHRPFIDSHCHFDFPPFCGNEAASLSLSADAGISHIIVPAVAARYFKRIISLSKTYSMLYAALGLHPLYIASHQDDDLAALDLQLHQQHDNVIAVGEIGLDLSMLEPQYDRQCEVLAAQLELAKRYDLPVILHSRRTHDRLAQILRRTNLSRRGVVHGFAGSYQQALAFVGLGYAIGVGGTITYPRANKTRQAIAQIPLANLLLETDAPDMPLQGFQGQPNRPERAVQVFEVLCTLRSESAEDIAHALYHNACALFGLHPVAGN